MSKRKQSKTNNNGPDSDSDDGNSSDVSLVNVDFDFFDPNPKVDFIALKRLLSQLFQADSELFHLNELAELILSQPLVGTTVKTDGIEGDPYAYLTVLNMHVHQNHPSIKALTQYVLQKSTSSPLLHAALLSLLGPEGLRSEKHVGFVFSERLVNMPVQVIPPMYRMLLDEIKWAVDDNEPYRFTHYLFLTRTYRLTPQQAAELQQAESARPTKKRKGKLAMQASADGAANANGSGSRSAGERATYSFHPEDEYIQKHASHTLDYALTSSTHSESRDGEDAFGLDVGGRMMLVPAENLRSMVEEMNTAFAVPESMQVQT
ncbi:BCP1 [Sanghuangporus vaninii]